MSVSVSVSVCVERRYKYQTHYTKCSTVRHTHTNTKCSKVLQLTFHLSLAAFFLICSLTVP